MTDIKSVHFWAIHRRVTRREWQNLDFRVRDIIAADSEHTSREFKIFEKYVNGEAERLFNDPHYFMNEPFSFRHSQFEDIAGNN